MSTFFKRDTFTAVQKAELTFYGREKSDKSEKWNVMINPNSISRSLGYNILKATGIGDENLRVQRDKGSQRETISMDLIFDLVDVYDLYNGIAQTSSLIKLTGSSIFGGKNVEEGDDYIKYKFPKKFNTFRSLSDISLTNEKISCLTKLIESVNGSPDGKNLGGGMIEFKWGGLGARGYVTSLNIRYTYFSPKGEPLRAEVSLAIEKIPEEQASMIQDNAARATDNTADSSSNIVGAGRDLL